MSENEEHTLEELLNGPLFQIAGSVQTDLPPGWIDHIDEYIVEGMMGEEKQPAFEDLPPEGEGTCNVTSFRFQEHVYTISTTCIVSLRFIQSLHDIQAGYMGPLGNYETMLFIDGDSLIYPFGDLPGHSRLGVFQRYETEEEARDGHQIFVTRVKRQLVLEAAEEREWDAIVSQPHVQAALRRMEAETRRAIAAGETEEGGFGLEP